MLGDYLKILIVNTTLTDDGCDFYDKNAKLKTKD